MMKMSMRNCAASTLSVVLCLVATVLMGFPVIKAEAFQKPDDLRSIPMQIVSGIPIWVAGESSDPPSTQPCVSEELTWEPAVTVVSRPMNSPTWHNRTATVTVLCKHTVVASQFYPGALHMRSSFCR